jgi:hypothetical protein
MPDPTTIARSHALQRLVEAAEDLAATHDRARLAAGDTLPPDDAAYLRAMAETCRGVATRLRNSPGYLP